jgi:F-type H+-transporting ATPase subunit a
MGLHKMYDHVVAALVTFLILLVLALVLKSKAKLIPGPLQQAIELVLQGILGMLDENIGPEGRKYLPLVGTLAFFIFVSNFLGLVPSFSAATANFNTTVACAVIVFLYYNFQGIKEHGGKYIMHFMGPMLPLAPLMFPIEVISHLARPFSLSMRLFGNISGEHSVALVFYGILPFFLPVPLMAFGLFAAFLQTFIFIMLTMVYIAGSISHEH